MQGTIVVSIAGHLDALEALVNSLVLLAVAVAWAGVRRNRTIEALGTSVDRRHAFFVVSALYLLGNMAAAIIFLRLGDLVSMLDKEHLAAGFWQLALHPWLLNPFSYFGAGYTPRAYALWGHGLLVVVWWLCNISLAVLMDDKKNGVARALLVFFLALGLASMFAIARVDSLTLSALGKAGPSDPELQRLAKSLGDNWPIRTAGVALGSLAGGLLFTAINILQVRWTRDWNS